MSTSLTRRRQRRRAPTDHAPAPGGGQRERALVRPRSYPWQTSEEAPTSTDTTDDPDATAAPGRGCRSCGATLHWAQVSEGASNCWFAICACGLPAAHFPLRPKHEPADPITAAFGPAQPPGRPPWIRVFQLTAGYPWWLPWRHVGRPCACGQRVTFAVWTRLAGGRSAYSELCLACGRATSEYLWPKTNGMREAAVSGGEWSPPCVAVARLRRAVFSAYDD